MLTLFVQSVRMEEQFVRKEAILTVFLKELIMFHNLWLTVLQVRAKCYIFAALTNTSLFKVSNFITLFQLESTKDI